MILDSKDKIESQKITGFYTSNNFSVNYPKSVSGDKRIDIEEHSILRNIRLKIIKIKLKFLTITSTQKKTK